jgi:Diguanylate cyclase, GGDEF domain
MHRPYCPRVYRASARWVSCDLRGALRSSLARGRLGKLPWLPNGAAADGLATRAGGSAYHVPNRRSFLHRAEALIGDPARQPLAVVVVELDDFKKINDEWGHAAGDEVLITIAHPLGGLGRMTVW